MAEMNREYHENLLSLDRDPDEVPDEEKLSNTIGNIRTELSQENIERLRRYISEGEIEAAMTETANDKATGLDGIPVELWKLLHQQYKSAKDNERHNFCNITLVLTKIFRDIAEHGIMTGTAFNEGWMCLIYKKKVSGVQPGTH